MSFTLIAHRGYSSEAPENTFEAFDLAIERGFNNFEMDAQLTKDGAVVVVHDDAVDRTTNGHGNVRGLTLAEIKLLDAGSWFNGGPEGVGRPGYGSYAGARVPTLAEVLARYRGRAHIHLELKSFEQELPSKVAQELKKAGYVTEGGEHELNPPRVTISSFFPQQLHRSRRQLAGITHGWLLENITLVDIALCVQMGLPSVPGTGGIYPRASAVTAEEVGWAKAAGLLVRTWGVGSVTDLKRAFDSGASGTTVDWPGRAKKALGL
jgi:glycerophosphoryl diester phosphodiesterase